MTALASTYDPKRKDGELVTYPVAASAKIYKGGLVSLTSGYAKPAADTASTVFVGVAYESADNSAGSAGDKTVRVLKTGSYLYNRASSVAADVGKACQVADDNTVATTGTTNSIACGYIAELVDASHVRVRIDRAVQ